MKLRNIKIFHLLSNININFKASKDQKSEICHLETHLDKNHESKYTLTREAMIITRHPVRIK